jgi:hypothetical protein
VAVAAAVAVAAVAVAVVAGAVAVVVVEGAAVAACLPTSLYSCVKNSECAKRTERRYKKYKS